MCKHARDGPTDAVAGELTRRTLHAGTEDSGAEPQQPAPQPEPQPGRCYKQFAYAPVDEPAHVTLRAFDQLQADMCEAWQRQLQQRRQREAPEVFTLGSCTRGLLVLHTSAALSDGGTGCHEWEAGFLLAEHLLTCPELCRGERGGGHALHSQYSGGGSTGS